MLLFLQNVVDEMTNALLFKLMHLAINDKKGNASEVVMGFQVCICIDGNFRL